MVALSDKKWTVADYLAFERTSEEKHEFIDGVVYMMSGASRQHNLICGNTFAALHSQLRQQACEIYMSDMRVHVRQRDYVYPDLVIACGDPQFEDSAFDTLLNPTVIIEVLSPSTEQYDRGKKFESYRALASLQEYLLISQDRTLEHYVRQAKSTWQFSEVSGSGAILELPSIGMTLTLAQVYERVVFDDDNQAEQPD